MEAITTGCAIVGILITLFKIYVSKEKVRVTAYCSENTLLTKIPEVPGLTILMQYKNATSIDNLWRICYTLENTGNKNIIGEGNQTSLVSKGLPLYARNVRRIIQISLTDNNVARLKGTILYFKQWRPGECITIEAFVESEGGKPEFYIDERDIINAKVI